MILSFLRKLDTLRVFTESGIEFKIVTPILVKDFFNTDLTNLLFYKVLMIDFDSLFLNTFH